MYVLSSNCIFSADGIKVLDFLDRSKVFESDLFKQFDDRGASTALMSTDQRLTAIRDNFFAKIDAYMRGTSGDPFYAEMIDRLCTLKINISAYLYTNPESRLNIIINDTLREVREARANSDEQYGRSLGYYLKIAAKYCVE